VAAQGGITAQDRRDLCAGFQASVADVLAAKTRRAIAALPARATCLAVAGGVAANRTIRTALTAAAAETGLPFLAPPLRLCTDNAAMIAWAGIERLRAGWTGPEDFVARPRWPLDCHAAPLLGSGKKGAKA
jgi:N6-L-threonylcarbamoyladenine synthase